MIIRIIGNNLGGGARKHCYLLNAYLESIGKRSLTFIPKAPFEDPYSDNDKVPFLYKNSRNWFKAAIMIYRLRLSTDYVHIHLRNVAIIFAPIVKALNVKYVVTVHAPNQSKNGIYQIILSNLYKYSLINANLVIFVSDYVQKQVCESLHITKRDHFKTIYNGSEEAVNFRKAKCASSNTIKIVVVGELTLRKGIESYKSLIPKLAHKLRRYEFHFFGEGPLKKSLEEASLKAPSNVSVSIHGYQTDPSKIYSIADLHCILATNEAFGRVITEAMAYSIPTLAISSGAFPEIITDKKNGWIAESIEHAANTLNSLSSNDLAQAGKLARITYENEFSEKIFSSKTIDEIEKYTKY